MNKKQLINKWGNHMFVCDPNSETGELNDFKKFAKDVKTTYRKLFAEQDMELVSYSINYYDLSGFVKRNDKYVYFSWSWDRFNVVDLTAPKVLYRTATNTHDFQGGINNRTSFLALVNDIDKLL